MINTENMKKNILSIALIAMGLLVGASIDAREIHVSKSGSDFNDGSAAKPYLTISKAARVAVSNDEIIVHEGIYREWVSPEHGGITVTERIVYRAADGEKVVIKGSEEMKDWKKVSGSVWQAVIDNRFFGDFNPFATNYHGDWLRSGSEYHLGEVYFEEKALQEVLEKGKLKETEMTWYVECNDHQTTIYANFGKDDPRNSFVEINARQACFYPKQTGMNYITVKGFKMMQAAPQWAPPTGEQQGLCGPNWSKGWIIEDCEIAESKNVGISLGTIKANGNNKWTDEEGKPGYNKRGFNRQIETVFRGLQSGWNEDFIGSHLIQNCKIYNCGQSGIVGHMGGINSIFRHNEIFNTNNCSRVGIGGAETAGIKLHAAIDAIIEDNVISTSAMGIWLDWQSQGIQVRRNLFFDNRQQDILVEVSHGPTFIYNNLLLSNVGVKLVSQGVAIFNNLIAGLINVGTTDRYTPYHFQHTTAVKGLHTNFGGDCRFYNNIFLGNAKDRPTALNGPGAYDLYPMYKTSAPKEPKPKKGKVTEDKANSKAKAKKEPIVTEKLNIQFPVTAQGNVYLSKGAPYSKEIGQYQDTTKTVKIKIMKKNDSYVLNSDLDLQNLGNAKTLQINTALLGYALIPEELFENPDGTPFELTDDFYGHARKSEKVVAGPFQAITDKVLWKK